MQSIIPKNFLADFTSEGYLSLDSSRLEIWLIAIKAIAKNPIIGNGAGTFSTIFENQTGFWKGHPHNLPLELAVSYGLPGTLIINKNLKFICKDIYLKVINNRCIFTHKLNNAVLKLPIAHKMGNYVATKDVLKKITENDQIVFKYCSKDGNINETYNPNGSISNIAGILSLNKKILGMMPHPERYTDMKQKDIIMKQMIGSML